MSLYANFDDTRVLIVAHDAGGANILAHLVDTFHGEVYFALSGPAGEIFLERFGEEVVLNKTLESLHSVSAVVTGTSEKSDFEWQMIQEALSIGKPVYAVLDHWINYAQRFVRDGIALYPTEIWVADKYAFDIAVTEFPDGVVRWIDNPYTGAVLAKIAELRHDTTTKSAVLNVTNEEVQILYVTEPAGRLARNLDRFPGVQEYTEFDAVRYFLDHALQAFSALGTLTIRVHPSEPRNKYDVVLLSYPDIRIIVSESPLAFDLAHSTAVVGTHSNVLAIAVEAKSPAFSAIPPGGIRCILPHPEIVDFSSLIHQG